MSNSVQLFEDKDHAQAYASHRPVVPESVVQTIRKYIQDGGCECKTAVDVGCGTGHQSTVPFSRVFNNVVGLDISKEQINQAPKDLPNVTFRVGRAEDLSFLKDDSVDLVSVATAIHWLDTSVFYKEVKRVLKPGGCLAVCWFDLPVYDNADANASYYDKYFGTIEFVHENVKRLFLRNEHPPCPSGHWVHHSIKSQKQITIADHILDESTSSFSNMQVKKYSRNKPLDDHKQRLIEIYSKGEGDQTVLSVGYNLTLLLWRKEH